MTKTQKGFTLIELLVVIAIIGILAGILFVAINPKAQTDKADDAADKSAIASIRTQAALVFSSKNDYVTVKTDPNVTKLFDALNNKGTLESNADAWIVTATMNYAADGTKATAATGLYCADSAGFTGYAASPTTSGTGTAIKCK